MQVEERQELLLLLLLKQAAVVVVVAVVVVDMIVDMTAGAVQLQRKSAAAEVVVVECVLAEANEAVELHHLLVGTLVLVASRLVMLGAWASACVVPCLAAAAAVLPFRAEEAQHTVAPSVVVLLLPLLPQLVVDK